MCHSERLFASNFLRNIKEVLFVYFFFFYPQKVGTESNFSQFVQFLRKKSWGLSFCSVTNNNLLLISRSFHDLLRFRIQYGVWYFKVQYSKFKLCFSLQQIWYSWVDSDDTDINKTLWIRQNIVPRPDLNVGFLLYFLYIFYTKYS